MFAVFFLRKKYGPPVVLIGAVALLVVGAGITHHAVTAMIGAVLVVAWAEALYDPAMASGVRKNLGELRAQVTEWLIRLGDDGRLGPHPDVAALATVLLALLPGFLVLRLLLGDLDASTLEAGMAQLLRPELLGPAAVTRSTPGDRPTEGSGARRLNGTGQRPR